LGVGELLLVDLPGHRSCCFHVRRNLDHGVLEVALEEVVPAVEDRDQDPLERLALVGDRLLVHEDRARVLGRVPSA